jgi:hypothetical protein
VRVIIFFYVTIERFSDKANINQNQGNVKVAENPMRLQTTNDLTGFGDAQGWNGVERMEEIHR